MEEKKEQLRLTKIRSKLQKNYIGMNITDFFQKINLNDEEENPGEGSIEVKDTAEKIFKENNMFSRIDAYVKAYHEIIDDYE